MAVVLLVVFAMLLLGNALLAASSAGFRRVYTSYLTGEYTVAPEGAESFTIFGSEALLVSEYQVPPTIINAPDVLNALREDERISAAAGLVSSRARLEGVDPEGGSKGASNQVLFGVDFQEFFSMFPEFGLVAGEIPQPGEAAVLLQEHRYEDLNRELGQDSVLGEQVLVTTATEGSFTIRELRIAGVYRYPVDDELLRRVALVDAGTARALNGYVQGADDEIELTDTDRELLDADMDDLFGAGDAQAEFDDSEDDLGSFDEFDLGLWDDTPLLPEADEEPQGIGRGVDGTFNFILLRSDGSSRAVQSALSEAGFSENQYQVRNWRRSAGGIAQLVSVLQLLLNLALGFITVGALAVTTNALVLSVLERSREIGTLRAMGAGRRFVSLLIAGEAAFFVLVAAVAGLGFGSIGVVALNNAAVELDNPFIAMLFGSTRLEALLSVQLLLWHLVGGLVVALLAVLYPLKRVLEISPVRAMSGDSQHA